MQVVEAGESDAASRWLLCRVVLCCVVGYDLDAAGASIWGLGHFAGRSPACSSLNSLAAAT